MCCGKKVEILGDFEIMMKNYVSGVDENQMVYLRMISPHGQQRVRSRTTGRYVQVNFNDVLVALPQDAQDFVNLKIGNKKLFVQIEKPNHVNPKVAPANMYKWEKTVRWMTPTLSQNLINAGFATYESVLAEGAREKLLTIPSIGEARADAIIAFANQESDKLKDKI